jgi:hypothetical protein
MAKRQKMFEPGHGYTKKDWDQVDSPELSDEQIAKAKPFAEALPELAAAIRRGQEPDKARQAVSIKLNDFWRRDVN